MKHRQSWRTSLAQVRGAFFCALLLAFVPPAVAATFTAKLDRDTTFVEESVTLSLAFEGGSPKTPPAVPGVLNLRIVPTRQQSGFQIANGQATSTLIYSYDITPTQAGDYTIPSIRAVVGSQTLVSQPLKLKVLKAAATTGGGGSDQLSQFAFLKLIVPKNEVYVGEIFPVEIRLYVYAAEGLQIPQLNGEGFTLGNMPKEVQTRVQVGNAIYQLVTWRLSAIAAKAGNLTLGPAECQLVLHVPVANRRQRDPFGMFDDDFFGFPGNRAQRVPRKLASEALPMRVLRVPTTNAPPSFSGAVGQYTFAVSVSPTNVAVGDPITIKTRVAGRGSFDNLTLPPLSLREFQVYPPTSRVETSDPLGIEGAKTFEQVVVPQNTEVKGLPPLSFSFFDPEKKDFVKLSQPATPLVIRPTASAVQGPTVIAAAQQTPGSPPQPQDIVHIKTRPGALLAVSAPLVTRTWFVALQGVPVLAFFAALVWRKRQDALANNPRLRRRRQVAQMVRAGLRELPRLAAAQKGEEFFATVFHLVQEQLGERLDLPASAITEAVLEERLRPAGLAEDTLTRLHELFQVCNQARYAPQQSSQEMLSLVPKVEAALRALQDFDECK